MINVDDKVIIVKDYLKCFSNSLINTNEGNKRKKYMNSLEINTVLNIYTSNERWLFNDDDANSSKNLVISTKVNYSLSTERQVAVIGKNESRSLSENTEEEKEIMILTLKKRC